MKSVIIVVLGLVIIGGVFIVNKDTQPALLMENMPVSTLDWGTHYNGSLQPAATVYQLQPAANPQ